MNAETLRGRPTLSIAHMTPDEVHQLEQRMDALAREYGATHDPKILKELKELSRQLRESEEKTNTVEGEAPMSSERGPGEPTVLRLLQNERVDVVRMISQPGDKGLGKPRTDRVLYVINGAKVRFHYPDGRTEDAVWKTGDKLQGTRNKFIDRPELAPSLE